MACEEAWLLGKCDPLASIRRRCSILGPVPTTGQNEVFKNSVNGKQTFVIQAEKVPNAAGIRRVIGDARRAAGDVRRPVANRAPELTKAQGRLDRRRIPVQLDARRPCPRCFKSGFRVVQDILPSSLTDAADVAAARRRVGGEGRLLGELRRQDPAVRRRRSPPPEGARREGDVYYKLLGRPGLYNAEAVRQEMGEPFADGQAAGEGRDEPAFEFVEVVAAVPLGDEACLVGNVQHAHRVASLQ